MPGLRRERRGCRRSSLQHAEQPAHLGQRLAAGLLDRDERLPLALLLGLEQPPHRPGLHGHHRDVVRDDVVQLARDPRPLLLGPPPRPAAPAPRRCSRPRLGAARLGQLAAEREAARARRRAGRSRRRRGRSPARRVVADRDRRRRATISGDAGERLARGRSSCPSRNDAATTRGRSRTRTARSSPPRTDTRRSDDEDRAGAERAAPAGEQRQRPSQRRRDEEPVRAVARLAVAPSATTNSTTAPERARPATSTSKTWLCASATLASRT